MTRRRIAILLAALVALSGAVPVLLLAAVSLRIVQERGERGSQEALHAVAMQAAARIDTFVAQQREALRALAMAVGTEPDAARKLADASLDAPALGNARFITSASPAADLPSALSAEQIRRALDGSEVASPAYLADVSPAMDVCVPSGHPERAVCATLDLLELQRQVQRIRFGESGYALAFDRTGRLLAAGFGPLRASVISGEAVAESPFAARLLAGTPAPQRLRADGERDMFAGWAALPDLGWAIAVEQPEHEALRGARIALLLLAVGALAALVLSIGVGYRIARRMLGPLELEERFRTAGQIAAGITHDLGHRLATLRQIQQLAATNDPDYLPRIRDSLASEVETLRRFVGEFSDLTREAKRSDFMPMELNAFAESVRATASPHAEKAGIRIQLGRAPSDLWVHGDRYLLERAALNLLRNAVEASRPGSTVHLRVERRDGSAALVVQDQGSGIAADRLGELFESFSSTKRVGRHIGMGLPNVRRIATAHGGQVAVKSRLGEGSVFTLSLPVADHSSSSRSSPATMP
ncbi:MAG TPA: sensor histidine kinase [Myxococcales bacterium]